MIEGSEQGLRTDLARLAYQGRRQAFWDRIWSRPGKSYASRYYHRRLSTIYRFLIPEGSRVLELGCGQGDLLAELRPKEGVGVDFSEVAVSTARETHPELHFVVGDAHEFDVVVLSDLIGDVWDVQQVLKSALSVCAPESRLVLNFFNRAWQLPIGLARRLGLAHPTLRQKRWSPRVARSCGRSGHPSSMPSSIGSWSSSGRSTTWG
jgi:SAM-dependent methyltransferase